MWSEESLYGVVEGKFIDQMILTVIMLKDFMEDHGQQNNVMIYFYVFVNLV